MKLSVWSSYFYHLSPEDALRKFKSHGFNYCELSSEHSEALWTVEMQKRLAQNSAPLPVS